MPDSEANEPSKADLERRVDQLEATVQKMMPTRRGVLAGLAGAGIGGAAVYGASENARAQAAGQVGTGTNPVDAFLWNLNVANQVTSDLPMNGNDVTGVGVMDVEGASTKVQNGRIRYNDRYGTLQEAIDESPLAGSVIVTEDPGQENITTTNEAVSIIAFGRSSSTLAIGDATLNGSRSDLIGLSFSGEISVEADVCNLENLRDFGDGITIKGDFVQVRGCFDADITFDSGTEGGFAYANPNSTVTDNGNNEILTGA